MRENSRKEPRYELEAYVDLSGSEVLLHHKICNISLGGICLQTATLEAVGTIVDLVISFPDLDQTIVVKGEVVWSNPDPPQDMGIRYIELDDATRRTLRRYLQELKKKDAER